MERVELRRIDMAPAVMATVGGVWWGVAVVGAEVGATGVTIMDGEVEDGSTTTQLDHDSTVSTTVYDIFYFSLIYRYVCFL